MGKGSLQYYQTDSTLCCYSLSQALLHIYNKIFLHNGCCKQLYGSCDDKQLPLPIDTIVRQETQAFK